MALAFSTLSFLLDAYNRGVTFNNTVTLGRAQSYLLPREIHEICRLARRELPEAALQTKFGDFADAILSTLLRIDKLEALDYSPYQGASIIHDLNLPVGREMEAAFDAVIDLGTIEHVFNFPVAIANCMKMVQLGGRLFIVTVANNHCGHGFYQFSPELFFRLFNKRNGFRLERMLLLKHPFPGLELGGKQQFYTVQDPNEARSRAGLVTNSPVMLLLEAERQSMEEILATYPQQSDYTAIWRSQDRANGSAQDIPLPHRSMERLRKWFSHIPEKWMPYPLRRFACLVAGLYQRYVLYSLRNENYYQRSRPFFPK
jgi:hypothetical protein